MYKIALLDTETWNTTTNAALMEVACLTYDIKEEGAYWMLEDVHGHLVPPLSVVDAKFNFREQMDAGRTFSIDTVEFHARNRGWEAVIEHMKSGWGTEGYTNSMNILTQIRTQVADCEEIWINGTSFDPPILRTLLEPTGPSSSTRVTFPLPEGMELWHFRKERDLRSFRKVLKLCSPKNPAPASHHAYADCEWMARQLVMLGSFLTFGVHDEQLSTNLEPERLRKLWATEKTAQCQVVNAELDTAQFGEDTTPEDDQEPEIQGDES